MEGSCPYFIDGRLEVIGDALFKEYSDSFSPGMLQSTLAAHDVQMVLLNHQMDSNWTAQLQALPNWRLLYFDAQAALYARADYRPDVAPTSWSEVLAQWGLQNPLPDSILTDLAARKDDPLADWLEGFWVSQDYPMPLFRLGAFAYENGQFDAARAFYLEMLKRTGGKYFEVYYNMGAVYNKLGRQDLARLCFQKTLELHPEYSRARQKLE